jgi:hypothetical protein
VIGGLEGSLIRWALLSGKRDTKVLHICAHVRSSVSMRCDIWH